MSTRVSKLASATCSAGQRKPRQDVGRTSTTRPSCSPKSQTSMAGGFTPRVVRSSTNRSVALTSLFVLRT